MRSVRFAFFAVFMLAGLSAVAQSWQLVWADEFNGTSVGPDWTFETGTGSGGWGNNELQYYRSQNASVSGGQLVITARRESFGGMQYTSARLKTQGRKSWRYGKIEARISMPSFQGVWPAFWMLGDNITSVGWPACGEIDIMEHVNTGGQVVGTMHWRDHNNNYANYGGSTNTSITSFHTYTIEWNSSEIRWFVDGVQYHVANILNGINGTSEFHNNFFIILNMAIGGNWPGFTIDNSAFPATMRIDWVRVYQQGAPPPPPPGGAPIGATVAFRGSNNQYVSGENGTAPMRCNRATAQAWEHFTVVDAGSGLIALRSMNKYVSSGNGTTAMTANSTTIGTQQRFTWVNNADGTVSLRGNNNLYVSSENGAAPMMCNRTTIQGWEKFTRVTISGGRTGADEIAEESTLEEPEPELQVAEFCDVYPNPAFGSVTIRVPEPSNVRMVTMTGASVFSQYVNESVTVDNLSPGVYVVNVANFSGTTFRRLLVK